MSNMAEELGVSVPIPTWEYIEKEIKKINVTVSFFFIAIYFGINIQSILINQLFIKLNMYILANNETFYYDILYIKHRKSILCILHKFSLKS